MIEQRPSKRFLETAESTPSAATFIKLESLRPSARAEHRPTGCDATDMEVTVCAALKSGGAAQLFRGAIVSGVTTIAMTNTASSVATDRRRGRSR